MPETPHLSQPYADLLKMCSTCGGPMPCALHDAALREVILRPPEHEHVPSFVRAEVIQIEFYANALTVLQGGRIAVACREGLVGVMEKEQDGAWVFNLVGPVGEHGHGDDALTIAERADGSIVSGGGDGTLRLWSEGFDGSWGQDAVLGEADSTSPRVGHVGDVLAVLELPGGRIVSAGDDHTVRLWTKEANGEWTHAMFGEYRNLDPSSGHAGHVNALALLPDGGFASAGDVTIRVRHEQPDGTWSCEVLGDPIQEDSSRGHTDEVFALATLPDGRLVSAGADHTVRVWTKRQGAWEHVVLGVLDNEDAARGHTSVVNVLATFPDGRIVSAGHDNTIRIWTEGQDGTWSHEVLASDDLDDGSDAIAVDRSGAMLVAGVDTQSITRWAPNGEALEALRRRHARKLEAPEIPPMPDV